MDKNENSKQQKIAVEKPCGIRSVQVSSREKVNYLGERDYRTVFADSELEILYIDLELINKRYEEEDWEAEVCLRLCRIEAQQMVCLLEKTGHLTVGREDSLIRLGETVSLEELPGGNWEAGRFCILAEVNGCPGRSEEFQVMQGSQLPSDYFKILQVGTDRNCDETEQEGRARPHSFRTLDKKGLKDIRFFLLAQNLLPQEWTYEFIVRVLTDDGTTQVVRAVKSSHYIKDQGGNTFICFAVDLCEQAEGFWMEGVYTVVVSAFGQSLLTLEVSVGSEDIPYSFEQEVKESSRHLFAHSGRTVVKGSQEKDVLLNRLYHLVGLRKVKEEVTQICEYAEFIRLRQENGFGDRFPFMHLIFTGHPGTGKNTVAEIVGGLLAGLGMLTDGKVHRYKRNDLVRDGVAAEEQLVRQALTASAGGVLLIDCVGELFNPANPDDRGILALGVLANILMRETPEVLVILTDETEEVDEMLAVFPDLKKIFSRQLYFEDYTPEELMDITRDKLEKLQYRFTPDAEEKFKKLLETACLSKKMDFTNGHFLDEQIEAATLRMSKRLMGNHAVHYDRAALMLITEADIILTPEPDPETSFEKLEMMVGLGDVKRDLLHHLNYVYFILERQKNGFADKMPPLNMIFCGNPGTGKLTVAKMIGEIYHATGVLSKPEVTVQNARNLTPDSGLTPQQGAAFLVESALGGILYLEEADFLLTTEFGIALSEGIFSALSTEECEDLVVILAGYTDRMEQMLKLNPALQNYFPYTFQFKDYTPEELLRIAENKLAERKYILHPKAKIAFSELIRKAYEKRDKRFGNALLIEKMVETAVRNLSERTMQIRGKRDLTRKEMSTLREADIPADIFDIPRLEGKAFDEEEITEALKELTHMVGQEKLKSQIYDFVELARHYNREGVKLATKISLQWCFTGNSAMGKSTVARVIGRLYKAMGIIDKGQVVEFNAEKLIGMMEEEAQRSIGEALIRSNGGIFLFEEDSPKLSEAPAGFRERVKAILMSQIAERPGAYIVIYAEPRHAVPALNGDAEHLSELVNVLEFEDYTREELMIILKRRLAKENMKLTATARQYMVAFIGALVATEERSHASSRLMRIVGDLMVRNCLQRIARTRRTVKAGEVISVQKQDVAVFTDQFITGLMNERRRIGFV